jgi:hypothetical protein
VVEGINISGMVRGGVWWRAPSGECPAEWEEHPAAEAARLNYKARLRGLGLGVLFDYVVK